MTALTRGFRNVYRNKVRTLIVIAILPVLAAIAIPQFSQYRIRAYVSELDADIKNIHHRFAYGLLGPLLTDSKIKFSKGSPTRRMLA